MSHATVPPPPRIEQPNICEKWREVDGGLMAAVRVRGRGRCLRVRCRMEGSGWRADGGSACEG
eukprot:366258-Chlamydomonas_euryale.AAC.10